MAVPDYQSIMLPLMKLANDGQEHSLGEAVEAIALQFHLTENERKELLPSGRQAKFENRVGWARTYLSKADLLTRTGRGKFSITARGREVMNTNPPIINTAFLMRYKEFKQFQNAPAPDKQQPQPVDIDSHTQTPEESLELSYQNLRAKVAKNCWNVS